MRFLLLVCVVFCLAGAWAQEDDDMYIEDQSGEGPLNMQRLGPSDDEDVETEGSGSMSSDFDYDTTTPVIPFLIDPSTVVSNSSVPNFDQTAVYEEEGEIIYSSSANKVTIPPILNISTTRQLITGEPATDKADDNNIEGKIKSVIEEKPDDRIEPAKEEPVKVGDDSEEDEKSVIDPATVIAGPSMQFLAAVIVGGCIGLLFAICVIMLLVYRMRKKDEGSYALDYGLDKKPQGNYEYTKGVDSKEYYA